MKGAQFGKRLVQSLQRECRLNGLVPGGPYVLREVETEVRKDPKWGILFYGEAHQNDKWLHYRLNEANFDRWKWYKSEYHNALDVIGLVPLLGEAADGLNAVGYALEGDYENAALSGAGMVPFAGWGATSYKLGKKALKRTTVIGETMSRVDAAAAKIPGAKTLNDMPEFTGSAHQVTSQMMTYNRQWILNELRSGRTILDIGRDANRTIPSIFYQMEQNMIKNYSKLHPEWNNVVTP